MPAYTHKCDIFVRISEAGLKKMLAKVKDGRPKALSLVSNPAKCHPLGMELDNTTSRKDPLPVLGSLGVTTSYHLLLHGFAFYLHPHEPRFLNPTEKHQYGSSHVLHGRIGLLRKGYFDRCFDLDVESSGGFTTDKALGDARLCFEATQVWVVGAEPPLLKDSIENYVAEFLNRGVFPFVAIPISVLPLSFQKKSTVKVKKFKEIPNPQVIDKNLDIYLSAKK
jgi:hypothetical protein